MGTWLNASRWDIRAAGGVPKMCVCYALHKERSLLSAYVLRFALGAQSGLKRETYHFCRALRFCRV